jgi:signal transduction histidine kinase/ligand-binding sensor domain-containing protein/DNA-binding NarL/FixJ family response regulator
MRYIFVGLLVLLLGCSNADKNLWDEQFSDHPAPHAISLKSHEDYAINPHTGDSIKPIINSKGDTVKTGVPLPASFKVLDPGNFEQPLVVPTGTPSMIPSQLNLKNLPGGFPRIPIDTGSLITFRAGIDSMFLSQKRLEGIPEPMARLKQVKGRPMPSWQPEPVKARPPMIKDNARTNIKFMDVEHGMSSTNLVALLEDSGGRIWIATQTKGVSMYDGEYFRHFTEEEGLSSNYVTSMIEDDCGHIWFGTLRGITIYDGCSFEHIRLKEDTPNIIVWSILEGSHGNLWLGTNEGLFMYNGDSFTHLTERDGLINNHIWTVTEDEHGLIWLGTMGGVSIYNGRSFCHLTQSNGLTSNRVWAMLRDRQGLIWIGTDVGLNVYDGESITHITENDGLIHNVVRTIQEDSQGNLWIGTHGGVSKYDGESLMHITENVGLNGNEIRAVLEDSQGNIWFASENGGISIYYGNTFTYFSKQDGFREHGIMSFLEDSQHNFWFGDWGSGVSRYDGQNFTYFTQTEGLIQNAVFCILEDRLGKIWFGTQDGLCNYDGKTFIHFNQEQGLSDNIISALLEDKYGYLWIGTSRGGVNMYDGKTIRYFTENEGLVDNRVRTILEDRQGNLWFGTMNGASRYNGETFTHFTEKEGLWNHSIICMLEDNLGNIWFGTHGGGVYIFDGTSFLCLTQKEGLCNNYITSMVEDHNGHVWITTKQGLSQVAFEADPSKRGEILGLNHKPVIHSYSLIDGLKSTEFIAGGVLHDSNNRIWWGSPKGIVVLDPDFIKRPTDPPVIKLTGLDINGQFVDYNQLEDTLRSKLIYSGVDRFNNYPVDLQLAYTHNHLTLYFASNDWLASQKLQYAYMLEGLDDQWHIPTSVAMADYRNMPNGQYTFKVRAMGAANIWSEPFEYSFRVLPPPWFKWWAYVIYTFILILLVRAYRRFLINREKMKADLLIKDAQVNKMKELDHMKSRFFANISHEFRTPLTLIQGPVEELRQRVQGNRETEIHLFQAIKRNVKRLHELINQLLDISRLETGNVRLKVAYGNLVEQIKTIVLSFLSLAEHKKIKYTYTFPEDKGSGYFDSDKVEKIVINLISNAFKYTPSGGQIHVDVRFPDGFTCSNSRMVEIKVRDTGIGIHGDKLSKVFDRFYQVQESDSAKTEGTGLGLALVNELVDLYRGDIQVESEPGKGSTFTVSLPVTVEQFSEEEILYTPAELAKEKDTDWRIDRYQESGDTIHTEQLTPDTIMDRYVILIVEDNDDLRDYMSRILGSSYRILTAPNGKIGLNKALESIPDLVISDVMMPDMNGIEMCKHLKSDERTDHIPIVIVTAKAGKKSKIEGLETGADDYLIKPFDNEELKARVKNLLEQRRKLRDKLRLDFLAGEAESNWPPDHVFMKRLFEIFDKHLADPDFKIPQISNKLNLSQSQLRRKVLALSGYTPNELFRYHRLKKAAIYFRSGHTNVAQVMYLVGFNNQSYFAKCYRTMFGMTPSQFIVSQRNQVFNPIA